VGPPGWSWLAQKGNLNVKKKKKIKLKIARSKNWKIKMTNLYSTLQSAAPQGRVEAQRKCVN
jgi:hypothetical protein